LRLRDTALAVVIADNQREMVDMLSSEGYIISLGWHEELDDRELLRKVKSLCGIMKKECFSAERCKSWWTEKG